MLTEDYLMRMFAMLIDAMRESYLRSRKKEDPQASAELLDGSLDGATEIDGSLLLTLAPETMGAMLKMSGEEPRLMEYVSRTLLLSSKFYGEAGQSELASLRAGQARAVADSFGIDLSEDDIEPESLEAFFDSATQEE